MLAAVHLQHLLQVDLQANKNLLLLIIRELTTGSKLCCVLILLACSKPRKDASMLRGIRGENILSSLMQLFAFLAAILNLKLEETFEECVANQLTTDGYRNWKHATEINIGFS